MTQLFANNPVTTLDGAITSSATSINVTNGAVMPSPTGSDYFILTLSDGTNVEIVKCTSRSGNTLTVVRAQEGTTGFAFADLDSAQGRATAALFTDIAKKSENQTFTKAQKGAMTTLTYGATITPNQLDSNNFYCVLTGNPTLANFSNLTANQSGMIIFKQDATGSRVPAYGANYKNTQLLSTTANAYDIIPYTTVDLGGTVYIVLGSYFKNATGV